VGEYTDEGFRAAVEGARRALDPLRDIAEAVDWQEPVRNRIDAELDRIERSLDELERVLEDATQELL
jgi:hypothetical protein